MTTIPNIDILSDYDITSLNTLRLPSVARYFVEVEDVAQLGAVADFSRREGVVLQVIGGGSNLVAPPYIDALVVLIRIPGRVIEAGSENSVLLHVGAGENWHELVSFSLDHGLYGLENLALIPGCAGGAPVQNIGAYGCEVGDVLAWVDAYDPATGELLRLSKAQCELGYRDSIFKHRHLGLIITGITLRLSTLDTPRYAYRALEEYLEQQQVESVGGKEVFEAVVAVRSQKLPDPEVLPNVGSFFKNPIVSAEIYQQLKVKFPALVGYVLAAGEYKLAAGWLIDHAGWRGRSLGTVAMHTEQALVLVNLGGATRADVEALRRQVCADCIALYGVELEAEPRWL